MFISKSYSILIIDLLVILVVNLASITNNLVMNQEYIKKFAKNLKRIRKEKKLTQDDIAGENISRAMVSLVEIARTDITLTKIKAIADALDIPVKNLFDFE